MSNTTHRKRLARRLAAETGRSYASAAQVVRRAAEAGALPDNLDEPGMQAALAILTTNAPTAAPASTPSVALGVVDATTSRRTEGQHWTTPEFLATCAFGDPLNMLTVATNLAQSPLVETWWHPDAADRAYEATDWRLVRRPKTTLTEGGELVLVDVDGDTSEEVFGWADDPDKAARHRIHPDGLGVTFCGVTGEPQRTHRALFSDEAPTSMAQIEDARRAENVAVRALRDQDIVARAGHMAASEDDPAAGEENTSGSRTSYRYAHDGNDVPRCTGTSWRDKPRKRDGWEHYGPGGYNRCVKAEGHDPVDGGDDPFHVDEWGHMFRLHPRFRVIRTLTADETAQVARDAGIHVSDTSDVDYAARLPQPNTLWVLPDGEMVQISNHYEDEQKLSAQVVLPVPPRTTVRFYPYNEIGAWKQPTDAQMRRYERAWGFDT